MIKPRNTIQQRTGQAGIYIHFPWCKSKCNYCDFYSVTTQPDLIRLFANYKNELLYRIKNTPSLLNLEFDTIYLGGGTPSIADAIYYNDLLITLRNNLNFRMDAEVTIEANPENITLDYLESLHQSGINRISVGIQSFQKHSLLKLGREYSQEKYDSLLEILHKSAIKNISIDLIYGHAEQTLELFLDDLQKLINSKASHLSLYSLTAEKNTLYYQNINKGIDIPPNEKLQETILEILPSFLKNNGFNQYEVSNYCKPGLKSKHNMKYWTMEYYLALGPGAHGFIPEGRYANRRSIGDYLNGIYSNSYEKSDYYNELSLTLFRIFYPINLSSFILDETKLNKIKELMHGYSKKKLCAITDDGIFRWEDKAVLQLDNLIYQIANTLG